MTFSEYCIQNPTYKDIAGKHDAKSAEVETLLSAATKSSDKADIEKVRSANDELSSLSVLLSAQKSVLRARHEEEEAAKGALDIDLTTANPLRGPSGGPSQKSLAQRIMDTSEYKSIPDRTIGGTSIPGLKNWKSAPKEMHFEFGDVNPLDALKSYKAGEITTTNAPTFYQAQPGIVPYAQYPATLFDLLPSFRAISNTVTYFRETARTNAAASRAETVALPRSTFTLTRQQDVAQVIGGHFKISEEEIMDRPDALDFILFKANLELRIVAETQILTGSGSGTDLVGIYSQATGSYAKGTYTDNNGNPENDADAIAHALQDVRINGVCRPDLAIMHPNQFLPIRLMKNAIGDYIWGPPSLPTTDMYIMGLRMIESLYAIDGQALIGDFAAYYSLGINQGITLDIVYDGTDRTQLERTALFWFRGLNQVRRPRAFEIVTGLSSAV